MADAPVAGPSRPSRRNLDSSADIANRIVALQRKNAALVGGPSITNLGSGLGYTTRRGGDGATSRNERDRSRDGRGGLTPQAQNNGRPPSSPRRLPTSHTSHQSSHSLQPPAKIDEFSRGAVPGPSSQRALFDPSRPVAVQVGRLDRSPRQLVENDDRQRRRVPDAQSRRGDALSPIGVSAPAGARKLFDPAVHDPHHFTPRSPITPSGGDSETGSSSSRLLVRRGVGRSAEEEADRERERRRRREGSERGSIPSRKKDSSDAKSKGSRSSEGSESFKDRERGKGNKDAGVKPILKKIHDEIKELEQELIDIHRKMSQDPEAGISILLDRPVNSFSRKPRTAADDAAAWVDLIAKHKRLAEMHDHFLVTLYDPLVPSSYHQLSVKYNIPSRLWQTGFHLILERLRHAWMSNQPTALDLLTDVVYDAYRFYTELLENQALVYFRTAWIEALGDLARYRMAIASHVSEGSSTQSEKIHKIGRIDVDDDDELDMPPVPSGASIGAEVAQSWDVEDKETWRTTARDWYTMGITEKPGEGRLHHHLALLCRDVKGQEVRALHHFVKSLTVTHEFATSRESILPLFDSALQSQRSLPEATAMDLFIRLHGMLFTKIQLDDFPPVLSRYMERLEEDASLDGISRKVTISQVDWMIMGSVNLAGVLQYGISTGLIRKALAQEGAVRRRAQAQIPDEDGDGEDDGIAGNADQLAVDIPNDALRTNSPAPSVTESDPPPITLTCGLELAFGVLDFVLSHPNRIQGFHQVLNPYITIFLTFLCTLFRQPHVGVSLVAHVPWNRLAHFVNSANIELVEEKRLVTGAPLPEDWLVRGMEWVGRRVYERGFWKTKSNSRSSGGSIAQPRVGGERLQSEMDVLLANFDSTVDISEGVVDEVEGTDLTDGPVAVNQRRWKRVAWAVGVMAKHVDGLEIRYGKLVVEGVLEQKIKEVERQKREEAEEERRRERRRKEKEVVDEAELLEELGVDLDDIGEDGGDAELAALRHRLRELKTTAQMSTSKGTKSRKPQRHSLQVVPGFTMLIFDTNVILDSLALFKRIVEGGQWSVVVPLPVVTELDGLSKEPAPLGANAKAAVTYLETHIHTHSLCLKIQTTKGNYLSDLLIRTEHLDDGSTSNNSETVARTMDDRILNIASFAKDHFADRSALLGMPKASAVGGESTKVCLVSNDRNLRLKARGRGVDVADEKELTAFLARV
ncbi:hypothetical protein CI109_101680 [Kwoniella shandongensis]|uniref:Uncharacterized protein n=1 Tax=Kwoniella shandongensis TaxID=1734106 RepID=A0A5M6C5V7_9TREE|nr:uncharacterized protein CI109_001196 [Kwoniella shandongensis]KAA5530393.1 hypothetical protein CI109_001196 [Kwoniella shandongensis]